MKLPPYMMDPNGYCYPSSPTLALEKGLAPWHGEVSRDGYAVPGTAPRARWHGKTVACIASGPSLTLEDCDAVRRAVLPTITANDSWRAAPYATAAIAVDHGWWQQHMHENPSPDIECWTDSVPAAEEFDLHLLITQVNAGNSGARAIELAFQQGAARVLLLGYDCSLKAGSHWHGDHTRTGNPTEDTVARWHTQFAEVARVAAERGVEVINCSRATALTCFPRADLRDELAAENTRHISQNG